LHLLIITRADTAAGLACVRFLGDDQTAIRTLPRVDMDYLRPLLAGIAPEDAKPVVVSNPTCGWLELRERLERDLEAEGAILMQQVRTALLGLRQLPLLTTKCYRAAGGLRGIEVLVVSRAVRRAGEAGGGGEAGLRTARIVLGGLILPGGPNQPPKGQRAPLSALSDVAGDRGRTEAILRALQDDEVVRPAEVIGGLNAWQLDHDYLARAVLAETLQAARWSLALREGKARYDEAAGDLRRRWAALLPFPTLVRVCWERARKRLTFGDAASYVSRSAVASLLLAPLLLVPLLVLIVGTFSRASQSMEDFGNFSVRLEVVATSKIKCPEDTVPLLWAEPINLGDVKPFQRGNYIARGCEKAGLEVHGPWIALYSNGQIVQEGTFDNGRRNGKVTKGRRIGDEIVWDLDGKEVTRRKQ
jgi:hypothetical protein